MTQLLPNPDYLRWFLHALEKARKDVVLVNYLAVLRKGDGKGSVGRIVAKLIAARRRGLSVTVILEGSKFHENYRFYRVLKDAGVDVWMDTSLTFIHQKAVLIDGRLLCIGSHNLTASALTSHEELALTTRDRAAVRLFREGLHRLTAQRRAIGDVDNAGVQLPSGIVDSLIMIKRALSPRAYSLYLLLCRLDRGRPKRLSVEPEAWVDELGFPPSVASDRQRVHELLLFLSEKLDLVRYDRKRSTVTRKKIRAGGGSILLPDLFWEHAWHKRLSVEAIHLYLAGERERLTSPYAPWWRLKRDEIAAQYGFSKHLVGRAQMELRRAGLLEVLYETAPSTVQRYVRYRNYFRQNPFYDADARMAAIAALARRCTKPAFALAQRIAHFLGEDSDLQKIDALCGLISKAGLRRAGRVYSTLQRLAPNSTRRTFAYAEELFGRR